MARTMSSEELDKSIKGHFEDVIRELAMQRAMLLKLGIMTEEEITDFLNEKGAKYTKRYQDMDPVEIMLDRVGDMIEEVKNGRK
jgi:hypothetical protein